MFERSSARIALTGEGGVAGAPALHHRNLIHTSLLAALWVHKHGEGENKNERRRGHRGFIFKARLQGWEAKKKPTTNPNNQTKPPPKSSSARKWRFALKELNVELNK